MENSWLKQNSANIITSTRIIGTFVMLFLPTLSVPFLVVYAYTGFTDVLDGFVARRLKVQSEFGGKLDSASDLFFYITMMLKIFPYLVKYLPAFIMMTIYCIFGFRMILYLLVWMYRRKIVSSHSYYNKATGVLVYLVPFLIKTSIFPYYGGLSCGVAILAAAHDVRLLIAEDHEE